MSLMRRLFGEIAVGMAGLKAVDRWHQGQVREMARTLLSVKT